MAHHEPFKALGPIEWSSVDSSGLASFLPSTFASAQTLIDSIPLPTAVAQAQRVAAAGGGGRRGRSHTDSAVGTSVDLNRALAGSSSARGPGVPAPSAEFSAALQKEWKECKVNPRDNPLAINVYRLPAKDGRGSWFARRSIHEGIGFAKFRLGLEREFAETMKVRGGPGAGKVRGIGAERRLEHQVADGVGHAEVYQLSAHFGGPTTPRDFVTLLLSSANADQDDKDDKGTRKKTPPRQFLIISRPCIHDQCPPRTGFIRGQYESVEVIREVPIDKPLRRTRSSIDITRQEAKPLTMDNDDITREAILRSARKVTDALEQNGGKHHQAMSQSVSFDARSEVGPDDDGDDDDRTETVIEWLMITRSDPGGSVPRFMVEKGTPGGIVSDAGLLLKWLATKDPSDFDTPEGGTVKEEAIATETAPVKEAAQDTTKPKHTPRNLVPDEEAQAQDVAPSGFYGMIAGALGAGVSVVASRMPNPFGGSTADTESDPSPEADNTQSESDQSSIHSFASAMETPPAQHDGASVELLTPEMSSIHSARSDESRAVSAAPTQHEKELRKLEERRRKVQEKMSRVQERSLAKKSEDKEKDAAALRKLKEKHEREVARQEEKYQRELQRIEQRRLQDERKADERRRKQVEREEKASLSLELERTRAERDVARKQLDILKDQIGELQAQNTKLVATLGKNGLLKEEDFRQPSMQKEKSRLSLKE